MLRIVNIEEIQDMLLRVSGLVELQENRGAGFVDEVMTWLESLEKVLSNNRMLVAANLAALRGVLLSAKRGVMPEGIRIHGRITSRKIAEAAASDVLRAAAELASSAILPDSSSVADAERQSRQIVVLARAKGLSLSLPEGHDRSGALKTLWRTLATDPDIGPGTVNVESLVGPNDALIILDRAISRDTSPG